MKTLVLLSALMLSGCGLVNPETSFSITVESEEEFFRCWTDNATGQIAGSVVIRIDNVKDVKVNGKSVEWCYSEIDGVEQLLFAPVKIGDTYKVILK